MLRRLMVIENDDIEAELARFRNRLMAHRAAIDGDEQRRALLRQRIDRLHIRAIALKNAIRNMDKKRRSGSAEKIRQQRRRAGAIDVVVAEDGDRLARLDRRCEPRRRRYHVDKDIGIGHQPAQGRIEIERRLFRRDAAPGKDPRQQVRMAMQLHHRLGPRLTGEIEAVAPRPAEQRTLDAQKGAAFREKQGKVHASA